jgi:KUP system potassium uptake protein
MLGALGVVFGDIGTSPLYAVKETFSPHTASRSRGDDPRRPVDDLLVADGVITVKYVAADHARRQPRRGRHHGADRARAAQGARDGRAGAARVGMIGMFGARCSSATAC